MRKRRNKFDEENSHERWLVSYADFITLLFAFFVVMYAVSQQDIQKAAKFEENIRKQFKVLLATVKSGSGGQGSAGGGTGPMATISNKSAGPQELGGAINSFLEGEMGEKERTEAIESLRADSNGVRMSLLSENYFKGNSLRLRAEAMPALRKIGLVLENSKRTLVIEGHSFSKRKGLAKNPWDVGAIRANQILNYFLENHNLSPSQIVSISYGDTRPIGLVNNPKNDRIEILIVTEDLKL